MDDLYGIDLKGVEYPLIRLPKSHAHLIGETAHIFDIDNNGKPLLVISLDKDFNGDIKIVQSSPHSDLETRLKTLEKQMESLEKLLHTTGSSYRKPKEQNCGGPGEIRTHDPRRVKAMS